MAKDDLKWTERQLKRYKSYFGFADWTVGVTFYERELPTQESSAETTWDITSRKLEMVFYPEYIRANRKEKLHLVIHELVHARLGVAQDAARPMVEKTYYEYEEQAVIDIINGFERMNKCE